MFRQIQTFCSGATCPPWELDPGYAIPLSDLGLPLQAYAIGSVTLEAVTVLAWCALATLLFRRRPDDGMALFAAVMLVTFVAVHTDTISALAENGGWWLPVAVLQCVGAASLLVFFYVFPDGRFVPRWTGWMAAGWVAWCVVGQFSPTSWPVNHNNRSSQLFLFGVCGFFAICVAVQAYRYRCVSGLVQRQQSKWVIVGFTAVLAFILVDVVGLHLLWPNAEHASPIVLRLIAVVLFHAAPLLLPLSIAIAILRYRLFDIDALIGQALLYGTLTVSVVAIYVLVVGYLGAIRARAVQCAVPVEGQSDGGEIVKVEGIRVVVEAPDPLPALSAAIEVAVYRIAEEALTNVVRHAKARSCLVRLSVGDDLCLEIVDDGLGLPIDRPVGVGLTSIRERAAELGGVCLVESIPSGGTRVIAHLPLTSG
jgi:Histidine kinase-, DNA gyrase B-, and HSP90-like ATPase